MRKWRGPVNNHQVAQLVTVPLETPKRGPVSYFTAVLANLKKI